jgi:hypothetical protein
VLSTQLQSLRFSPEQGIIIRQPKGHGYGYWVGGMRASYDSTTGKFYLFYRQRAPLEHGRGGECFVAESSDGIEFRDVFQADRDALCANSIEVGHLIRTPDGEFRLYLSYEYKHGAFWRIDVLRGSSPDKLDVVGRRTVIAPQSFGLSFVKDPFVCLRDGQTWLYAVGSPRQLSRLEGSVVEQAQREATLLFRSEDGLHFEQARYVFEPSARGWDRFTSRLGCLFDFGESTRAAFYDGARSIYDMYEESTGLATTANGVDFVRVSKEEPWLPPASGNARYAYGLRVEDTLFVYYEFTRADGSHDMRVTRIPLEAD